MYKSTLILAIAFISMAFVQSGKSNQITFDGIHVNNTLLSIASPDQGGNGNKGGNKNKSGGGNHGNQSGASKHNSQGPQGNNNGNGKIKQHPQSNKSKNNQAKDHGNNNKPHKQNKHDNRSHSKVKNNKPGKNHFDKGHPNFLYVYDNNHGHISHKNYGQWRSEQARNKHKKYKPVYEYEAVEGFNLIISRNVFLHTETEYKINLYRNRLSAKRKAGTITVTEYDHSIRRVTLLEQRRAALQISIKLS